MRCELIGLTAGALAAFAAPAHAQKTWTSADNVVTLAVPKGWETFQEPGYDFFSEAYIDDKAVANCYVKMKSATTAKGATQDQLNAFPAGKTAETVKASGPITHFSNARQMSGVRLLEFTFEPIEDGLRLEESIIQFGYINGAMTAAFQLTCAAPKPLTPQISKDLKALLDSITIKLD